MYSKAKAIPKDDLGQADETNYFMITCKEAIDLLRTKLTQILTANLCYINCFTPKQYVAQDMGRIQNGNKKKTIKFPDKSHYLILLHMSISPLYPCYSDPRLIIQTDALLFRHTPYCSDPRLIVQTHALLFRLTPYCSDSNPTV